MSILSRHREQNAPPAVRFAIGEVTVHVSSDLPEVIEDLAALYPVRPGHGGLNTVIRMEVRVVRRSLLARPEYVVFGDGERLWSTTRRREVLPYVEWGINWRLIQARTDCLQLHAATLSCDGTGVILAADSGSGKSTLAAGLIARGWQYLSDEFALIDPETLYLHPFPKALCIKSGAFDIVEGLGLPLWRDRHYVKALKGRVGYVSPHAVGPETISPPCRVGLVIFPTYVRGAEPRLVALPRAQAAMALAAQTFNRQPFGPQTAGILSRLVRSARCFHLQSGELASTCELLQGLLPTLNANRSRLHAHYSEVA